VLGSCVHFLSIFLVLEDDGNIVCDLEKVRIGEFEDSPRGGAEYDASHSGAFCLSRLGCLGAVLTGAHCEKETAEDNVGCVCVHGQSSVIGFAGE
jgi:hypothetical protein